MASLTPAQREGAEMMEKDLTPDIIQEFAVEMLTLLASGGNIIRGIEAHADNLGIDLGEARRWWQQSAKLLTRLGWHIHDRPTIEKLY